MHHAAHRVIALEGKLMHPFSTTSARMAARHAPRDLTVELINRVDCEVLLHARRQLQGTIARCGGCRFLRAPLCGFPRETESTTPPPHLSGSNQKTTSHPLRRSSKWAWGCCRPTGSKGPSIEERNPQLGSTQTTRLDSPCFS